MSAKASVQPARVAWRELSERGGSAGLLFVGALGVALGRRAVHLFAHLIAAYFALFEPTIRRVSAAYLRRMGLPSGLRGVHGHCLRFAEAAIDRLFLLRGETKGLLFTRTGHEHVERLTREGRGALLLGAHVGSFEAMRAHGGEYGLKVAGLVDFRNSRHMRWVLRTLAPRAEEGLLPIESGQFDYLLRAREHIQRGEHVALLADRVAPGERSVEVDFLGGRAPLPAGPFLLAAALRCPVYLAVALYRAPNRYELHFEPLFERVDVPRGKRGEGVRPYAQTYAERLERYVRLAPDNWFNFFDFWIDP